MRAETVDIWYSDRVMAFVRCDKVTTLAVDCSVDGDHFVHFRTHFVERRFETLYDARSAPAADI